MLLLLLRGSQGGLRPKCIHSLAPSQKHGAYPQVHLASYVSPRLDRAISRPVCFLGQASTVCLQLFTGLPLHFILVQGIGIQGTPLCSLGLIWQS